jgi:hypothetical protein
MSLPAKGAEFFFGADELDRATMLIKGFYKKF